MSSDLIYCQTIVDSRILQSTNMTNNTNNTTNSTNETLKNISIIDSNTYFSFDFYFLPIDNREIDLSYKSVYDCYNNSAKFINWINGNITGGSSVLNISEPFAIAFQESPSFSRFLELKVKVTDTSVFISEIGLSSNGSIYLEIYPGILINDTTPNYLQIMNNQQFNSSNGIKSTRVQFTYNGTTGTSYNFTNLTPNTSFIIAYFGTNDNPSYQDFLTTEIRKTNATTLNKIKQGSFGELLKIGGLFWVFLGILLSF